jgi:hypothetical protein
MASSAATSPEAVVSLAETFFSAAQDPSDDPADIIRAEEYLSQDSTNVFLTPSGDGLVVGVYESNHEQPLIDRHSGCFLFR